MKQLSLPRYTSLYMAAREGGEKKENQKTNKEKKKKKKNMATKYQTRYRANDATAHVWVDSQGNLSVPTYFVMEGTGANSMQFTSGSATGDESIALGVNASASDLQAVAVGSNTAASAPQAMVLGANMANNIPASIVLGSNGVLYQRMEEPQSVQQTGSNNTAVTLNTSQGKVVMFAAMGSQTQNAFTIFNDRVLASSVVIVAPQGGPTTSQPLWLSTGVSPGSLRIYIRNNQTVSTGAPVTIHFLIYAGA
jgi:hypothetical protein